MSGIIAMVALNPQQYDMPTRQRRRGLNCRTHVSVDRVGGMFPCLLLIEDTKLGTDWITLMFFSGAIRCSQSVKEH